MKNKAATAMPATTKNADCARRAMRPTRGRGGSVSIARFTRGAGDPSQFSPSGMLCPAESTGVKAAQPGVVAHRRIVLQDGVGIDHRLAAQMHGPQHQRSLPQPACALPMWTALVLTLTPDSIVSRSGDRRWTESMITSLPIFAPKARRNEQSRGVPLSKSTRGNSQRRSASHAVKVGHAPQRIAAGLQPPRHPAHLPTMAIGNNPTSASRKASTE